MRRIVLCTALFSTVFLSAQATPQRDPEAAALFTQSIAAMGGVVPADSTATGTVELIAGSTTETGTIRVVTRSLDQTAEYSQTGDGSRSLTYSHGRATEKENTQVKRLWAELTATAQSPNFPLALLAGALSGPEIGFAYIGEEDLEGRRTWHVRLWQSFGDDPRLAHLAEFSQKDLWIDQSSALPLKLSYKRRPNRVEDYLLIEVFYSDYRNVSGVLYPHTIKKHLNGTEWQTIKIQTVVFNTGLSDSEFSLN